MPRLKTSNSDKIHPYLQGLYIRGYDNNIEVFEYYVAMVCNTQDPEEYLDDDWLYPCDEESGCVWCNPDQHKGSALNKDFFIFLAWKSIEKYFSTSQKCIQNNFSDQKSIEKYFSISQKFIQNNFSYQKSIEKYFFNSLKFISMIFSDQKIIR